MARLKRYDLYEGDGEIIEEEYQASSRQPASTLPGKAPLGRDEALHGRDQYDQRRREASADRRRYFASNEEDDGLGAPSSLFDDFDRFEQPFFQEQRPRARRKPKHRGAWAVVFVLSFLCLAGMAVLMLPQLLGIRYRTLPTIAFVNGNILQWDEARAQDFAQCRDVLYTDTIYPGVYIDDVHVGGMTKERAAQAVNAKHDQGGREFDISVSIGNQIWHVNSERVPVSRNVDAMVEKAWAAARGNTTSIRGTGKTPFQQRVDQASDLRSYPLILTTKQDYDHEALRVLVNGIVNYVNRDPVNSDVATFDFNTHTFTFTDDVPGARIDADDLYAKLTALLDAGETVTTLRVVPEKLLADMTKAELANRFGLISAYTTQTTKNANRNTNIQLSAAAINGRTVLPGETFSFNKTTGERTAEKGYKEAAAISGGQSRDEVGGGVCQTSSTLFNAVARADLEIVERSPHAWPSNYVEKGFDATVNWPGLDFKFKNNTDWPIFIVAGYKDRKVTVNIYGMSLGADTTIDLESVTVREIPQPEGTEYVINTDLAPGASKTTVTGRKGYEVETWKVWRQGGKEIRRELLFKTTYKAYQTKIEYNPR